MGQPMIYVAAGDSITGGGFEFGVVPPQFVTTYVDRITSFEGGRLEAVINAGVGGGTVLDFAARLPELVLDHDPDVTTIMYGINDHIIDPGQEVWVPLEQFEDTLHDVATQIPGRVILMTPPICALSDRRDPVRLATYASAVRRVAEARQLDCVDVHEITTEMARGSADRWVEVFAQDGFHPNSRAHERIYRHVRAAVLTAAMIRIETCQLP